MPPPGLELLPPPPHEASISAKAHASSTFRDARTRTFNRVNANSNRAQCPNPLGRWS
jgi:hypothetical protein